MSWIATGFEYRIREFADTADTLADQYSEDPNKEMETNYARGVADVLRFMVGDTGPLGTLVDINNAYLEGV